MSGVIDLIGTLRRLTAAVTGIPTTAMRGTDNALLAADYDAERGTDNALLAADYTAERGTDNATLQATWTDAMATALANYTAARAAYLDELAAANIPSDIDDLLTNVAVVNHHVHSRCRVYPQSIKNTITLTANAAVDTFGSWTEIIPIDTVDMMYMVTGVVIEAVDAATGYFIQLGYSTTDGDDPTTAQILGERRVRIVTVPIAKANTVLEFYSQGCPVDSKLWGRLKTASLNADEADISVVIIRHQVVTNPIAPLATWPWAS